MVFTDPLQWITITVLIVAVMVAIVYFFLRVLQTLNKLDRYVERKERSTQFATSVKVCNET